MANAKLIINSPVSGDDTIVGMMAEVPISITLAIADIREPDKRNSTFSKTITIPGTPEANKLFEFIFEVTTDLNNFNPNLKTPCRYEVDSEIVFIGDLQLLKIRRRGKSPELEIMYEVSIVGRLAQAFLNLGNDLLEDLDFSDLNHVFNFSNRNWTPTLGTGYTYPLIDYGVNGGNSWLWDFAHLKPAIFELEYIDRIFDGIGKTYTSTFFASTYEKSILIPDNNAGALKMSASQINGVSFYAGKTADSTTNIPLTYSSFWGGWVAAANPYGIAPPLFNDDSTNPFYDGGGNYSTVNYTYTAPIGLNFTGKTRCDMAIRVNPPAGTNSMFIDTQTNIGAYTVNVSIIIPLIGIVGTNSLQINPGFSGYQDFSIELEVPSVYMPQGYQAIVGISVSGVNFLQTVFLNTGVPITVGTASIDLKLKAGSWYSGSTADGNLPIGYTVDMNQCVPKNIKQIDFLMSVIKSENLYMELDLTNPNNYIIERRADFYLSTSQALDWTYKWDYQKETEIIPMGELDFRKYLFSYKTDGDKYNKLYKDSYGEVYAQEQINVENDFIKNEKKTELIFGATPMVGNNMTTLVYPVFAQDNGTNLKPMAVQIRRLYWGGLTQLLGGFYQLINAQNGINPATQAVYPFAGTVDNPYSPTLSIDWGIPKVLYYSYPGQIWTTNNLYTRNYQSFIEQITNENSKIVTMWMYLKPSDIANFTFRKPVYIWDSYYLVNKIIDYNPQEEGVTKVELLQLVFVNEPTPEDILIWQDGAGSDSGNQYGMIVNPPGSLPNNLNTAPDGLMAGQNNVNQGVESGVIGGEFNFIGGVNG